jgi:hypothetical protein
MKKAIKTKKRGGKKAYRVPRPMTAKSMRGLRIAKRLMWELRGVTFSDERQEEIAEALAAIRSAEDTFFDTVGRD